MSVAEDKRMEQLVEEINAAPRDPPRPPAVTWMYDGREGTVTLYEAGHDRPDIVGCWLTIDADHACEVNQ